MQNQSIAATAARQSTQATAKAPLNMLEYGGEWYYTLTEDAYNDLLRAEGALSALAELMWATKESSGLPPEQVGDLIAYPADALREIIKVIHSFKN